jgi:hypothetical protein
MRFAVASSLLVSCLSIACSPIKPEDASGPPPGKGTITGKIEGLTLATDHGVSIARAFPPTMELKVAIEGLTCNDTQASDRLTIDLGSSQPGTYTVVRGYPGKTSLAAFQARAHACPKKIEGQPTACHESVTAGKVVVTKVDPEVGGIVEGNFDLTFVDGTVSGTFAATRCQ